MLTGAWTKLMRNWKVLLMKFLLSLVITVGLIINSEILMQKKCHAMELNISLAFKS